MRYFDYSCDKGCTKVERLISGTAPEIGSPDPENGAPCNRCHTAIVRRVSVPYVPIPAKNQHAGRL